MQRNAASREGWHNLVTLCLERKLLAETLTDLGGFRDFFFPKASVLKLKDSQEEICCIFYAFKIMKLIVTHSLSLTHSLSVLCMRVCVCSGLQVSRLKATEKLFLSSLR